MTLSTDLLAWSLYRGALGVGEMCSWRKLREGRLARLNGEGDRKWRAVAVRRVAGDTRAQDKHEREGLDLPKYLRGLNEVHGRGSSHAQLTESLCSESVRGFLRAREDDDFGRPPFYTRGISDSGLYDLTGHEPGEYELESIEVEATRAEGG